MVSDRVKEYFRRWPEPDYGPMYEHDCYEGDKERMEFLLDSTVEEQKEILRREGVPEDLIDLQYDI